MLSHYPRATPRHGPGRHSRHACSRSVQAIARKPRKREPAPTSTTAATRSTLSPSAEIPNDGVLPDNGLGSAAGDRAAGGLAAKSAAYDHLMLLGPAMAGYFSTPSAMPGAVIEPLYITDPFEGSIADSTGGQMAIARGIVTALEQDLPTPAPSA